MGVEQRYLTQREAAAYLRLSTRYLSQETAAGNIASVRMGRRVTYLIDDLDEYARRHRRGAGEKPEPPSD